MRTAGRSEWSRPTRSATGSAWRPAASRRFPQAPDPMRDKPLIDWNWVIANLDDIVARTLQHLQLSLLAVAAGFLIAMVLGVLTARRRRAFAAVTAFTGILYTIPSIAAFAALVPIAGLSVLTALIPLTAYTLLVLVRNIVAGITSVAPDVLEAADAMGYTRRR